MRADPTIDATNYTTRAAARKNAATGQLGQSDNALITAVGHAAMLKDHVPDVFGTKVTPFNSIANAIDSHFLGGKQPAYDQNAQLLGDEVAAAYGTNSQGKQNEAGDQFSSSLATQQKLDNIHGAMKLLASKLAANRAQFAYGNGQLGKPDFMLLPAETRQEIMHTAPDVAAQYFSGVPSIDGGSIPPAGPGAPPPGTPPLGPHIGPQPPSGPQSLAQMDPNSPLGVFKQTYRNVPDPKAAAALDKLAHTPGATFEQAAALVGKPSFTPEDWKAYTAYAQAHPGYHNATVLNSVPTTVMQRLASSPAATFLAGGVQGATAGLSDVAGRTFGGPAYDQKMADLAGLHPAANVLGNVAGGAAGMFGAGAAADALGIAAKAKQALGAARAAKLGQFAPFAQDIGYGATYGASEDPNNPLGGAALGALTAGAGGIGARGVVRAIGHTIAPTGGNLAPIFNANPNFRPTVGQALSASNSPFARALGKGEQAFESIPALGGIQTSARTAATDQMQLGAYNHALADLAPFNPVLGRDVSQLPDGVTKGTQANEFLQKAMGDAQQAARSQMQFAPDQTYVQEFGQWQRNPDAMSLTTDQRNHVQDAIRQAFSGRMQPDGTMPGQSYASAASDLARVARNWSGSSATAPQAAYLRDYLSIMDGAASRASPPEASALLDAANRGYAKSVIIENAAKAAGGEPTEFTGKQLLKAVQNSDPSVRDRTFLRGQGLMQDYATAASKLSPSLADSGTPQRLAWMRGLGGAEGLGLGAAAAMGHPEVLAPLALDTFANLPGIRSAVGAAMAPRDAVLPPMLANPANLVGQGLYKRANSLGMFGAPLALSYFGGQ
jgi:hypothetical protein